MISKNLTLLRDKKTGSLALVHDIQAAFIPRSNYDDLGYSFKEIAINEDATLRIQEAILTATLEGKDPAVAIYRKPPKYLSMTTEGAVIAVFEEDNLQLFDDMEEALCTLMIYPEELEVTRISVNPNRLNDPWFQWALDHVEQAPSDLKPFIKEPLRGIFSILKSVADECVYFAQESPLFIDPNKGPVFIFLTAP